MHYSRFPAFGGSILSWRFIPRSWETRVISRSPWITLLTIAIGFFIIVATHDESRRYEGVGPEEWPWPESWSKYPELGGVASAICQHHRSHGWPRNIDEALRYMHQMICEKRQMRRISVSMPDAAKCPDVKKIPGKLVLLPDGVGVAPKGSADPTFLHASARDLIILRYIPDDEAAPSIDFTCGGGVIERTR